MYVDDVKLVSGKTNGDILLHDLRRPDEPVRLWGTHDKVNLTLKRSVRNNYSRLRVESLDCSLTTIYGISRFYAFEINLI